MAKLSGVKTLGMVNGEITRIEYDGAVYGRVADDSVKKDGDIVLSDGTLDAAEGNFYRIDTTDRYGDKAISDDVNAKRSNLFGFVVFRKINAQPTQPKYRKVTGREPRVGDFVKFSEEPITYLTAGKYYEIEEIDGFDDPQILDDDGDEFDTHGYDFEVYELAKPEQAQQPQLKVGDYAKVVKPDGPMRFTKVGDIVRLISVGDCLAEYMILRSGRFGRIEVEAFVKATDEEIEAAKAEAERKAVETKWAAIGRKPNEYKEGDIVRVKNPCGANLKSGDLVEALSDSTINTALK